jgi:hypothetical protein
MINPTWSTADSNIFVINSNVGIGTSTPQYALHVIGSNIALNPTTIMTNGDVVAYSDMRLKTDVRVIPDAIRKISQIGGYTYVRNDDKNDVTPNAEKRRMAGVLAQEMQAVLPEVVYEDPGTGTLAVAYGNIVALLIQGIKELSDRVERLENAVPEVVFSSS